MFLKKAGQKVNICLWDCSDPAQNPSVPADFLSARLQCSRPGLPDGRGHGRITQNRQYKNKSGRGKLPAVKVAVSDKTIFLLLKGILADFLVG